ncbi:MAG: primosomal protein N' [Candidatus Omnitrophica bacterium]|nr:primosomal protein N' [Candidatus Omnitrophota bacterium]
MVKSKKVLPPTTYHLPPKYAQVVLGLPVDRAFTYSIPEDFRGFIKVGQRVEVPFGRRLEIGYIVGFLNKTPVKKIKPLKSVIDREPLLDRQMLKLTRRVADYYYASWGEVIEAAHPASVRKRRRPLPLLPHPRGVESTGGVESVDVFARNGEYGLSHFARPHSLSAQQMRVLNLITKSIERREHQVFLLHGITASGKTEVYLQAIACALAQGTSSIVLVPEISLTPQTVERFKARFGERVALMHSRLKASERASQWQLIKNGQAQIVIGARSAVFAPFANLGLIVVDEEHETTYKQKDTSPRYHARDVATLRAKLAKATVILGSATPSLESFYNAKKGRIRLLSLPERVTKRDLPEVSIIDMRREITMRRRRANILSRTLEVGIRRILSKGEQAILFLNRRGFSTFINCTKCGYVAKCKRCNVSLTYHYATKTLICHYCNYSVEPPSICPQCNSTYLSYFGLGTEKVESELHRLFPQARIGRMDTDAMSKRDAHAKILSDFKEGKIDILVGTQMVAKGLDFPRVSLVGVVSADTALNLPDFRSGERTFNLLTQVGGRAGRGEAEGKVIIQTYVPENYAVMASARHDYLQFYRREIKGRKALGLPPFVHLVNLGLRGRNQKRAQDAAEELSIRLKKKRPAKAIQILGPAPALIPKIRGNFHWNVLLKGRRTQDLIKLLRRVLKDSKRYKGIRLSVDVDPI